MGTEQLAAFAVTMCLGAMSPGPDFALVVRHAAVGGRRGGTATALGIAAGVLMWAVTAALGVAALLAASATAFTLVKIVGAVYLLFLGVRSLRAAARGTGGGAPGETGGTGGSGGGGASPWPWTAFRQGLLCNALNPKAAVFFVALMPQFLGEHPAVTDTLLLSVVAAAVAGVWFLVVANVVGALRRVMARERVRRAIDGLTGTAMIGLGLRLAASRA
ncbi:lysine transporter LysE [Actinomadura sp. NBRC 104412]|uniref:LysE family translocator n=1 Tax=Actinomadura sp. NBRC 104412 TaxID=3032203 RepID=UPI0024A05E3A|nr:LysE family translocator [Actinomadura sp. NBRC 104412]GLZ03358.1 lysine transporter LysE [Actinomadura sp. NBRC 104412]